MHEMYVYDCNLNIESFIHMLDDPTECYKFYWLDSIMQLLSKNAELITFDKVISGMIADAWYSVTEYHLRLGTKDSQGNRLFEARGVIKYTRLRTEQHRFTSK